MEAFIFEAELMVQDLTMLIGVGVCFFSVIMGAYYKLDPIINR
tara:strand:+ start:9138 stop:9266 length:129 start_codon:yes stop_codon:yes gene_type:complete